MAKIKIELRIVPVTNYGIVGTRLHRGDPMPMGDVYSRENGYYFRLDEREKAEEFVRQMEAYLERYEKRKGKK